MVASTDSVRLYMNELRTIPPINEKEIKELFTKQSKGNKKAKRRIIEGNLRLVVSVAKHYSCYGMDFLDLVEEGNLGLIRAIEKYDLSMGYSFSTYAFWWIRQYIQRSILNQTKTIHIPLYAYETLKKLISISQILQRKLSRQPTTPELAKELHISIQKTKRFLQEIQVFQQIGSLESPLGDKSDLFLKDLIREEDSQSPERIVELIKSHEELEELLKKLSRQEQKIIKMRFGLVDGKISNLREIGEKVNLSRERVRQIEKKAIIKLRNLILKREIQQSP